LAAAACALARCETSEPANGEDGATLLDAAQTSQAPDGGQECLPDTSFSLDLDQVPRPNPTIVVLPDTQLYAAGYPEIFHA
jgi:hypothetical protein